MKCRVVDWMQGEPTAVARINVDRLAIWTKLAARGAALLAVDGARVACGREEGGQE